MGEILNLTRYLRNGARKRFAFAPTDPVLSAPILSGRFAERAVPDQLRHAMTAESGINDGLGLPYVLLPNLRKVH